MAVNESLTVEQFAKRYSFIGKMAEQELEKRWEKSGAQAEPMDLDTTAGTGGDNWLYVNAILRSEAEEKLNDLAYKNSEGEKVVDYSDMRENFTPCSANGNICSIPDTYLGEPITVSIRLSKDEEGNRYLNVVKIKTKSLDKIEAEEFDTASIEEGVEVPA